MMTTLASIAREFDATGILPDGRFFSIPTTPDSQWGLPHYVRVITYVDGTHVERFAPDTIVTLHCF